MANSVNGGAGEELTEIICHGQPVYRARLLLDTAASRIQVAPISANNTTGYQESILVVGLESQQNVACTLLFEEATPAPAYTTIGQYELAANPAWGLFGIGSGGLLATLPNRSLHVTPSGAGIFADPFFAMLYYIRFNKLAIESR